MFRKINVPLLGIVENMSHYECPACGHKEHIFGEEGALRTAEAMKMDGQVAFADAASAAKPVFQPLQDMSPNPTSMTHHAHLLHLPLVVATGPIICRQTCVVLLYSMCALCGIADSVPWYKSGSQERCTQCLRLDFSKLPCRCRFHVLQVPLQLAIRQTSDAGTPIVAHQPDSASAQAYQRISTLIYDKLQQLPTQLQPPLLGRASGVT